MKQSTIAIGMLAGVGCAGMLSIAGFVAWVVYTVSSSFPPATRAPISSTPMLYGPATELPLQQQDYADARKEFHTKLLRTGRSPQPDTPLTGIPAGVRKIEYTSGDWQFSAYVDDPPADGVKRPAVLFLHGGFTLGGDDLEMPQPLRDAGYVVMVPILRSENGQAGDFSLCYDEVDDVLAAADTLAALPYVDSKRVFIAGHHVGGTLALLATMTSDRFQAAASISGPCNLNIHESVVIFDTANVHEYEMRSPVAYATSFKCPARIFFGTEDGWIPTEGATTAARAKNAGLDVEVITVPGNMMTDVPEALRRTVEFFKKIESGKPVAEAADAVPAR